MRARFLDPLGLRRTTYHPTEPFARGYVVHPWHGTLREEPREDAGAMAPAGQLWSTVADLARVGRRSWPQPDPQVLGAATVAEMCTPGRDRRPGALDRRVRPGLQLWRRGERVFVGHTGSMPGYLAILAVHRPSRYRRRRFANAYRLRVAAAIGGLGLDLLDAVLDGEPAPATARGGRAPRRPADVAPLPGAGGGWASEYEVALGRRSRELVIRSVGRAGHAPWRFTPDGRGPLALPLRRATTARSCWCAATQRARWRPGHRHVRLHPRPVAGCD